MNMPLIALLLKLHSRYNPYWTQEKIIALARKYSPDRLTGRQKDSATDKQENKQASEIDTLIMENNLQELLLIDEATIIKNLKSSDT